MVVWREFQIVNSFTLEASFFGYTVTKECVNRDKEVEKVVQIIPYTKENYYEIGKSLAKATLFQSFL